MMKHTNIPTYIFWNIHVFTRVHDVTQRVSIITVKYIYIYF